MKEQFKILHITRDNIKKLVEECTNEQLFAVPDRFNNNIIWNAAHIIVTQQLLVYGLSSSSFRVDKAMIDSFRKGTSALTTIDESLIDFVKSNLMGTATQLQEDYENNIFNTYKSYTTSYGITLNSIEEGISFNNVHEGMHYGQIKMLQKLVSGS